MITADELRAILAYDPETGVFTRKIARGPAPVGAIAGTKHHLGYIGTIISGRYYLTHRLAWLYVYGQWPGIDIDHVNGDKADNRIRNLREASRSQNNWNSRRSRSNTSGVKGVCWSKTTGKWQAQISVRGIPKYLGQFNNIEDARRAYREAAESHFGDFAFHVSQSRQVA